ncbi:MAG TPA: tyrosine-type recombinase/integrase [Saprospiraceae bacterium]|nr:tyrosine-type recombinase/integrase [Saprospiraceae bacterium]
MQNRLDGWIREFEEFMILKNFSPRTIKTYGQIIRAFLHDYLVHHAPAPLNDDLARDYLLRRYRLGLDWQTVNSDYSAIQKFFKNVILEPWNVQKIPRPRKSKKLPTVLSRQDVVKIIEHAANIKQQTLLLLVYITGIRLSEVIQLQLTDIDADRMQIRINNGKGNKDRMVLIPEVLIDLLRTYYRLVKPQKYLFNGINKGTVLSPRSVQLMMSEAKKKAGIQKKGSIHTLRNCYATHHLENGTDLVFLQEQMGHKNLRTTIKYIGLCVERKRYIHHPIQGMTVRLHHHMALVSCSGSGQKTISASTSLVLNTLN